MTYYYNVALHVAEWHARRWRLGLPAGGAAAQQAMRRRRHSSRCGGGGACACSHHKGRSRHRGTIEDGSRSGRREEPRPCHALGDPAAHPTDWCACWAAALRDGSVRGPSGRRAGAKAPLPPPCPLPHHAATGARLARTSFRSVRSLKTLGAAMAVMQAGRSPLPPAAAGASRAIRSCRARLLEFRPCRRQCLLAIEVAGKSPKWQAATLLALPWPAPCPTRRPLAAGTRTPARRPAAEDVPADFRGSGEAGSDDHKRGGRQRWRRGARCAAAAVHGGRRRRGGCGRLWGEPGSVGLARRWRWCIGALRLAAQLHAEDGARCCRIGCRPTPLLLPTRRCCASQPPRAASGSGWRRHSKKASTAPSRRRRARWTPSCRCCAVLCCAALCCMLCCLLRLGWNQACAWGCRRPSLLVVCCCLAGAPAVGTAAHAAGAAGAFLCWHAAHRFCKCAPAADRAIPPYPSHYTRSPTLFYNACQQCGNPKFGDYQCNNAMALHGRMKGQVGGCMGAGACVGAGSLRSAGASAGRSRRGPAGAARSVVPPASSACRPVPMAHPASLPPPHLPAHPSRTRPRTRGRWPRRSWRRCRPRPWWQRPAWRVRCVLCTLACLGLACWRGPGWAPPAASLQGRLPSMPS